MVHDCVLNLRSKQDQPGHASFFNVRTQAASDVLSAHAQNQHECHRAQFKLACKEWRFTSSIKYFNFCVDKMNVAVPSLHCHTPRATVLRVAARGATAGGRLDRRDDCTAPDLRAAASAAPAGGSGRGPTQTQMPPHGRLSAAGRGQGGPL